MHCALVAIAKAEGRSVSSVIKGFIDEGLQRQARETKGKKPRAKS
jgi:hypothetical protein